MSTARKRFDQAEADEKPLREEALVDLKFVAGYQWDPKLKQAREQAMRPAMTFPRCHTFVQQVSNEARQNKPQIKFVAANDQDKDTAEVYEGLARHIQYSSDAQIAYETAVEYSAGGSFGYFRFLTDYVDNETDNLELNVVPVLDPFAVYGILVPSCFNREPKFGFIIEDIPKEEFQDMYPKLEISQTQGFEQAGQIAPAWIGTDMIRLAEYWTLEETFVENKSGSQRRRKSAKVKFCKINGLSKMPNSETDWPGYCVPIVPVLGKQMIIQGKPQLFSVVRPQRSAQQMINYAKTRIAETLSSNPISPFLVARGQIAKGDKKWENLNTQIFPYLEYDVVDVNGRPADKPQRDVFEPPIASLSGFVAQEIDDMKATTGIFDASLGQKSNEQSGTAIVRRQQQSNMTTMHYMDNLERAFKKGGLIIADLIPKIYDYEAEINILGADEAPKIVKVNQQFQDATGKTKEYTIGGEGAAKYNVIVTMGRSFSSKRMESFDMMQGVLQGNPQLMNMVGDIFFRNSDTAGADQMADRFKKIIAMQFPGLVEEDGQEPIPPHAQAQIAQLQQQTQQATQALQAAHQIIQSKQVEQQGKVEIAKFESQAKVSIEQMKIEAQIAVAEINTKAQNLQFRAKLENDTWNQLHGDAHEAEMQAQDQQHQQGMAQQNADIAAQQSEQGHAQALEQQAAAQPAEGAQ